MGDHMKSYAKAYTAGAVVLVVGAVAADITNILTWLVSLTGVTIPPAIQASFTHILTALSGGVATAVTPNSNA